MAQIPGRVLEIVVPDGKHGYELKEEHLKQILLHRNVKNIKVVPVSIAGTFRSGKSFLLNFLLRYLATPSNADADWLNLNDPLAKLFHYRAGTETETKGIHMWSEPFLFRDMKTGKKLAVILMDTQGTFDNESNTEDTIFALSAMISSYLIYNIGDSKGKIGNNHIEYLKFFAEYGQLAMRSGNDAVGTNEAKKPFQSLLFLLRDSPLSNGVGFEGGRKLRTERLTPFFNDNDTEEMRKLRLDIRDKLFDHVSCFLMPEPGERVKATAYNGDLRVIDEDFLEQMKVLVDGIFGNLRAKSINGHALTGRQLFDLFPKYFNLFKSGKMPDVKNILDVNAEIVDQIKLEEGVLKKINIQNMEICMKLSGNSII